MRIIERAQRGKQRLALVAARGHRLEASDGELALFDLLEAERHEHEVERVEPELGLEERQLVLDLGASSREAAGRSSSTVSLNDP
jgi:hypothetical protein